MRPFVPSMFCQNRTSSYFNYVFRFLQVEEDHTLTCNMDRSDSADTFTYMSVTIDGKTHLTLNKKFLVVADPLVVPLSLDNATVFQR